MDFIDEQNAVGLVLQGLEHTLQALLEVTAVFGAGQQSAHVERINLRFSQNFRHSALGDAPGQALGNGRFAHTGLAHQQRVVLAAAAQNLDGALDFVLTTNQRINFPVLGGLVEVVGVLLQRRSFLIALPSRRLFRLCARRRFRLGGLWRIGFTDAVCNEVHHVQSRDALLVQVIHSVRVFFAKDGDQHVGTGDFFFAIARGLHVHDGALDDALKTQGGLGVHFFGASHLGGVVLDEVGQCGAQIVDVGGAGTQHFSRAGVVQQGEQQMLDRDELVTLLAGLDKGHVQTDFQFLGNHVISFLPC